MLDDRGLRPDVQCSCECLLRLIVLGHARMLTLVFAPGLDEKAFDVPRRVVGILIDAPRISAVPQPRGRCGMDQAQELVALEEIAGIVAMFLPPVAATDVSWAAAKGDD